MIKQFRSLNPINILLLIGIALLLRAGVLLQLPEKLNFDFIEPFARFLIAIPLETAFTPYANILIGLAITLLQAFIFNKIVNGYNLLGKPTFLPALLFVTASSLFTPFILLSPTLICNFILLWMIEKFLSIYRRDDARAVMFDLGMMVALGTLIYFPFIAMMPLLWISLLIFRPFYWREWLAGIIGFITVFFFLAVYYYWHNSLGLFYKIWLPLAAPFPVNFRINWYDYLVLIPVVMILALGIFQLRSNFFRSFVQTRKSYQLLFFMLVLGLISFYLKSDFRLYHFLLCAPPAAVMMAYYFVQAGKKRWVYECLYLLLLFTIIYFQIF
ncbi:beta-carotene 15,15'-monooxygenase [Flavihumibacter sp. R14]|nr:beta-carotene 15,15'-monooxygenase [Flavihumibacter soli]